MTIPPLYWTLLGELALVLIGVLCAVIFVVLKDRKNLREYSSYLKDVIKKLKKKLKEHEAEQDKERVVALLEAMIEHVKGQYQSQYGNEIPDSEAEDNTPSVEKFILISGYQTMIAELSALENSNEPEAAWDKIKNELTPLIQNYLNFSSAPSTSNTTTSGTDDSLQEQLDNASQRIDNLEKFKALYFELQSKMTKSVEEIEALNHQVAELAEGSDNYADIMAIIEKNKTHYIDMGQMIGMDSSQHHESVADKMDYSDELMNERKDEIKHLKHQISQQFEEIWKLQNSLSDQSGTAPTAEALSAGVDTMSRQLKDAELCIETMDMEIQTLTSEITNLKNKLKEQDNATNAPAAMSEEPTQIIQEKDQMLARFAQESKELMNCITGLEDSNAEQMNTIKTLEEKYAKLETEYADMEARYLESVK